ncbi:MAG: hypothetical protein GQ559_05910, partial [Desulfobulbaceae bacterium]|nr:hypothetical protein [Desulfobulbaceae bacterium]
MTTQLPLYPLWIIDIAGCLAMIVLSGACSLQTFKLHKKDPDNPLNTYLVWLMAAIFAFCLFRSVGHLLKHLLLFSGYSELWKNISPISGGFNTITFVVIFAVTLFFRNMLNILNQMTSDRLKIEQTSSQILELNKDIEAVVSDRTRTEMALQLAHEIRNPVMVIGGLIRRLFKDSEASERDRKISTTILGQTGQLESIVSRFEDLQSQLKKHFSTLELNLLIKDALEIVRHEAEQKAIHISFTPSHTSLPFHGNQQYMKVALLHLLCNSIEACSAGNHIQVTSEVGVEGAAVHIGDNGPGIPQTVLSHIFEPFYSTKDGATGLGLPYVRQIIQEHRGDITITSTQGQGTSVKLTLPSHL